MRELSGLVPSFPSRRSSDLIRPLVEGVLAALSGRLAGLYATAGRPSIPPERFLRAKQLQADFSVRSERQFMEQIDYNSLRIRKRIEQTFGWAKTIGGIARATAAFTFRMITYNFV